MTAKTTNGATPSISPTPTGKKRLTPRPLRAGTVCTAPAEGCALFGDIDTDDGVPLASNRLFGRVQLVESREHRLGIALRGRKRVEKRLRDRLASRQIVEADGVAVALEPTQLTLVGVEVLHPELGGVGMRRISADRLDVDAGE